LEVICRAYKWRWQVELLFKEWKSYANWHAFDTANPTLVEGLIWTAIAAAALRGYPETGVGKRVDLLDS